MCQGWPWFREEDLLRIAHGSFGLINEWPQWHAYHMQLRADL